MLPILVPAITDLLITLAICLTALHAWRGWLDLKRLSIAPGGQAGEQEVGLRIELAAVKERLKKLEAIASGVEL